MLVLTPNIPTVGQIPPKSSSGHPNVYLPGSPFPAVRWPKNSPPHRSPRFSPKVKERKSLDKVRVYTPSYVNIQSPKAASRRFVTTSHEKRRKRDLAPPKRLRPYTVQISAGRNKSLEDMTHRVAKRTALVCDELDKLTEDLGSAKRDAEYAMKCHERNLSSGIEEGKDMLPLDFLFARNMRKHAQKRGSKIVQKAMARFIDARLEDALVQWKDFVDMDRGAEKERKAVIMQTYARLFSAKARIYPQKKVRSNRPREKKVARLSMSASPCGCIRRLLFKEFSEACGVEEKGTECGHDSKELCAFRVCGEPESAKLPCKLSNY